MKRIIYIIASLLICASISSAFPVVYADEIDTTVPPEETILQEATPSEEEAAPAFYDVRSLSGKCESDFANSILNKLI